MTPSLIEDAAAEQALSVFGRLNAIPEDNLGEGTIVLLGPREPGFWDHVTAQGEFSDGSENPLDRWSRRAVTDIAQATGGTALFPFGDPVRPFIGWALRSGRAWSSPVGLLVHDTAGLMLSYRGAVFLTGEASTPVMVQSPCDRCEGKPCLGACPVRALTGDGYRVDDCHSFLDRAEGADCMSSGCAVRRTCPVSQSYGRVPAQSAFHMQQFHRT